MSRYTTSNGQHIKDDICLSQRMGTYVASYLCMPIYLLIACNVDSNVDRKADIILLSEEFDLLIIKIAHPDISYCMDRILR